MRKLMKNPFVRLVIGLGLLFLLWAAVLRMPMSTGEVVQDMDRHKDVSGKYVRFEVKEILPETAIGGVVHTDNRNLVIQSDDDKYWEIGKTYSYKILEVQEMLGVYVILLDTEDNGNEFD